MNIGYAIGNAESRKDFDIRKLSGSTYGCHSIHRDYNVQNLICNNLQHLQEAIEFDLHKKQYVFTTVELINIVKNPYLQIIPEIPFTIEQEKDQPKNWTSGSYAVLIAAMENDVVSLLGYDFIGKGDRSMTNPFGTINNIYAGSDNNPKFNSKQRDLGYDVQQIGRIIKHFKDVKFIFINDWVPETLLSYENSYQDTYENLENQLLTQ